MVELPFISISSTYYVLDSCPAQTLLLPGKWTVWRACSAYKGRVLRSMVLAAKQEIIAFVQRFVNATRAKSLFDVFVARVTVVAENSV